MHRYATMQAGCARPSRLQRAATVGALVAGGVLGLSLPASAQVILAPGGGYPAPGGTTFVSSGSALSGAGATGVYSGFDPTQYSSLYWTISPPQLYADGNATAGTLSYNAGLSNLAGGVEVWTGTTTVPQAAGGARTVYTEFVLDVTSGGNPLALTPAASIAGLPAADVAAVAVPAGGFTISKLFAISATGAAGSYVAAGDWYNSSAYNPARNASYTLNSSVNGSFYYTSAVPVPAAGWLLLSGVGGLVGVARRRRRAV